MGGKFAVLTAPLPPYIKDKLPQIAECKGFLQEQCRHNLQVFDKELNAADIAGKYQENEAKGDSNKILVVCNTVKKAQSVFADLREALPDAEINLLYSKFIKKDRAAKEKQILADGQTYCHYDSKKVFGAASRCVRQFFVI